MTRTPSTHYDATVVGSGPNGLAAAITVAKAGRSVLVIERNHELGGSLRSAPLTLPGFVHDCCASAFPLAAASPFFNELNLERRGLRWIHAPACLAHPLDDGTAVLLENSLEATISRLGRDGDSWKRLFSPFIARARSLLSDILAPIHWPHHPCLCALFARRALPPAHTFANALFRGWAPKALLAGLAAHGSQSLHNRGTTGFALLFGLLAHTEGWPVASGGAQQITNALVEELISWGGEIQTDTPIDQLGSLPPSRAVFLDIAPRHFLEIASDDVDPRQRRWRRLRRFRLGPGVFKIDWALDGPIPWNSPECETAATVHVGGSLAEITLAEETVAHGSAADRPFLVLVQPSLFDPSRAPRGKHTAWAYCRIPNGSSLDMTEAIEGQVERFASGFRDRILARHVFAPPNWEEHNPNCIGGDITGGAMNLAQLVARPILSRDPYRTPIEGVYLCSASTPPGGGVHGLCGQFAARAALQRELR